MVLNIAEEIRLMRGTINQQHTEITKLNRNIEPLNHQLRKKNEEIAKIKIRLIGLILQMICSHYITYLTTDYDISNDRFGFKRTSPAF